MAQGHRRAIRGSFLTRVGVVIAACTAALTLSFVGLVAVATGNSPGVVDRVPYYALGMSVVFVGAIIGLEGRRRDGTAVLATAVAAAVVAFVFLALGGEGLVYAARTPSKAFAAQQFPYLVAASLIGTGIGYWGTRHPSELIGLVR